MGGKHEAVVWGFCAQSVELECNVKEMCKVPAPNASLRHTKQWGRQKKVRRLAESEQN